MSRYFMVVFAVLAVVTLGIGKPVEAVRHERSGLKASERGKNGRASRRATRVQCDILAKNAPAVRCTEAWLRLVDAGDYRQSYRAASCLLQSRQGLDGWTNTLCQWRRPYGKVNCRDLVSANCVRNPSNYPDGEYFAVKYKTDFVDLCCPATEEIVLRCECDCAGVKRWKVVCYNVR